LAEKPVQWEDKNLAPWGSETQEDVVIDTKLLKAALKRVSQLFYDVCMNAVTLHCIYFSSFSLHEFDPFERLCIHYTFLQNYNLIVRLGER
jgi:hypothetical protein